MSYLDKIKTACEARDLLRGGTTDAYRLFTGVNEGISGLVVERYGEIIFIHLYKGQNTLSEKEVFEICSWYLTHFSEVKFIGIKKLILDRSQNTEKSIEWVGQIIPPEKTTVTENQIQFQIKPLEGWHAGLFLDQRENRKWVSELKPKRMLNLFSYTCSFSVVAATVGADTESIDLSSKVLEWGKENFAENALSLEKAKFFARDARKYVAQALKNGKTYDCIVLDPPSFARDKEGGVWKLEKDGMSLLEQAWDLLEPKGHLLFTHNRKGLCAYFQDFVSKLGQARSIYLPRDLKSSETSLEGFTLNKR